MCFLKNDVWVLRVPSSRGAVRKHTGTTDRRLARRMEAMVKDLADRREWDVLDAVVANRVTLGELWDATRHKDGLAHLRARLADADVEPLVRDWLASVRMKLGENGGTAERYEVHVRSLIPAGKRFPRSHLTTDRITKWLTSRAVGSSTRRKYRAALSSFVGYLLSVGVVERNMVRDVRPPKAGTARQRYLTHAETLHLIEASAEPYRTLEALLHGAGVEVSAALALTKADVDTAQRTVHAKGTKTHHRNRVCFVAEWAWPYLEAHVRDLLPRAPLFPGIDRWAARRAHMAACKALELEDYRMHDARHTYAVNAIRAGAPLEHVAEQLGHADTTMTLRVYGRYRPSASERRAWERNLVAVEAPQAVAAAHG